MSRIFVNANARMAFYMEECEIKREIKGIVELGGGEMLDSYRMGAIALSDLEIGFKVSLKPAPRYSIYSYQLVKDSSTLQGLPRTEDYLVYEPPSLGNCNEMNGKTRKVYGKLDNERMVEYVKRHPGHPNSRKYWETATQSGLNVKFSVESLKAHWVAILSKQIFVRNMNRNPVNLNSPEEAIGKETPSTDGSISQHEEGEEGGDRIYKVFIALYDKCKGIAQDNITEVNVLRELIKNQGDSQRTINYFK